MKRLNLYILVVCLLSSSLVRAQKARLLHASSDLNGSLSKEPIREIKYAPVWSTIKVRYQDGSTKRIPKASIWGYIDPQGNIYRQYKKDFFKLIKQGDLITYINVCLYCSGSRYPRPINVTYYSKTLDSEIYRDSTAVLSIQ